MERVLDQKRAQLCLIYEALTRKLCVHGRLKFNKSSTIAVENLEAAVVLGKVSDNELDHLMACVVANHELGVSLQS